MTLEFGRWRAPFGLIPRVVYKERNGGRLDFFFLVCNQRHPGEQQEALIV